MNIDFLVNEKRETVSDNEHEDEYRHSRDFHVLFFNKNSSNTFSHDASVTIFFERIYRTKNAFFLSHVIFISGDNRKLGKYFRKRVEKKKSD